MIRFSVLTFAASVALGARAHAEEFDVQPTVQVTASRVAETVDDALANVSVITRADLDASVARDVLDVLRLEAGIDLYRTGGAGQQTSLFLRGTNANQVLVLIDGVRAGAATTGAFAFEQLPLDAVERIEIVRGPRASYWGSDAIGGVIQIFTRKLEGPRVALGYGSWNEAAGSAGIGHWNGADGYSVQVGARHISGFSATNPGICNGPDDPYCIYNPDHDGFRKTSLSARFAHAVGGDQVLSASVLRSEGQSDFDQGYSDVIEQTTGINLEGDVSTTWRQRLALGQAREDLSTPTFYSLYLTRRNSLLWQNEIRIGENQRLIAGIDLVHDEGETRDTSSDAPRYRDGRTNRAAFSGWRTTRGALDGEVSLRLDDNSVFGGATTGSLAAGWRIAEPLRVYANLGQGFRSPTMNELFDPGYGGYFAGNPDLQPERSHGAELGLDYAFAANQQLRASLYSTQLRDLISFTGVDNRAENIARARIRGIELGYRFEARAWSARATYTWQDPRNADSGEVLVRRARQKASALAERRFGERFSGGVEIVAAGRRSDVGGVQLPGYAIVNLRLRRTLGPDWALSARLENLGDRDYELVRGYNTPGRSAFLELVWQPQR